jgi:hypothetical protein
MNTATQALIAEFASAHDLDLAIVEQFAKDVLAVAKTAKPKRSRKASKTAALSRSQLQEAIYEYFNVSSGTELRKNAHFKVMIKPIGSVNLSKTTDLEKIYRAFIGVLPNEISETGYGCINGIDIFKYSDVWTVFGIESKTATKESVQAAYHRLSKQYHPDMPNGDRKIFERLTQLYKAALLGVK